MSSAGSGSNQELPNAFLAVLRHVLSQSLVISIGTEGGVHRVRQSVPDEEEVTKAIFNLIEQLKKERSS
jgi:hypothetical protein